MTMSRQLINLAGALAAIVILALGILLVALPMFNQAGATDDQADDIAQTNEIYDIQVETLRAQEARLTDLERDLSALRAQIPATALNDQVFELIGEAVRASGVTVGTVTAGDMEAWTAPTVDGDAEGAPAAAPAPEDATGTQTGTGAENATGTETTDGTAGEAPPAAAPTEVDPQQIIPFTISVTLQEAVQASRFLDALRADDRLLTIEHAVLSEGDEGQLELTVNARSLVLLQK